MPRNFNSDNASGVCPEVMQALLKANHGHVPSYGADMLTREAEDKIKKALGRECEIFFVYNGTAANNLAAKAVLRNIDSIICPDNAHIHCLESGAPYSHIGCKLITVPATDGKITPEHIRRAYEKETYWGPHATRPKLVSITQSTELGTVYTLTELAAIKALCEELGMLLHVDGCRLYNAAVALDCSLAELCQHIDILSLGGTKNGLMFGEAVVFFDQHFFGQKPADGFLHLRKQGLQLHSKMRFIAAQMNALFTDALWQKNALQANRMAAKLANGLLECGSIELVCPVETNQVFVTMPKTIGRQLQEISGCLLNDPETSTYRLVTSFDTTEDDVDMLVDAARKLTG